MIIFSLTNFIVNINKAFTIYMDVLSDLPAILKNNFVEWQRQDLNLRPSAYEAPALTAELRCHIGIHDTVYHKIWNQKKTALQL